MDGAVKETLLLASEADYFTVEELQTLNELKCFLQGRQETLKSDDTVAGVAEYRSSHADEMEKDGLAAGTACRPKTDEEDPWAVAGGEDPWAAAAALSKAHACTSSSGARAMQPQG